MERLSRERKPPAWHEDMIATVSKVASVVDKHSSSQEIEIIDSEIPNDQIGNEVVAA